MRSLAWIQSPSLESKQDHASLLGKLELTGFSGKGT